jgi:hypothetical protein
LVFEEASMSGLASVTDARDQGPVFLNPSHIRSVHEISEGTEITLTVLSFALVVALLATIIKGLANICDALRKKLVRLLVPPLVDRRDPG